MAIFRLLQPLYLNNLELADAWLRGGGDKLCEGLTSGEVMENGNPPGMQSVLNDLFRTDYG